MVGKTGPRQLFLFLDAGMVRMGITEIAIIVHKAQNLRAQHFESYSSFSYLTHISVYPVFWPSSRGSKINMYAVDDPTTGPEHLIYRVMRTV